MSPKMNPQSARVPIAYITIKGIQIPAYIAPEWLRYLTVDLFARAGGYTELSNNDLAALSADFSSMIANDDLTAVEALRAVDELRCELASARSENYALKQAIDELTARLDSLPMSDPSLPRRMMEIEERLL